LRAPGYRFFLLSGTLIAQTAKVLAAAASAHLPCEVSEFERIDGDPASGIEVVDGEIEIPSAIGLGVEVLPLA